MARRVPRAHTQRRARSRRVQGEHERGLFLSGGGGGGGTKSLRLLPCSSSRLFRAIVDSTVFSLHPHFPASPPDRRSFHSVRSFFAATSLLPRAPLRSRLFLSRLSRASVTTVPAVSSLSFSFSFRPRCTLLN